MAGSSISAWHKQMDAELSFCIFSRVREGAVPSHPGGGGRNPLPSKETVTCHVFAQHGRVLSMSTFSHETQMRQLSGTKSLEQYGHERKRAHKCATVHEDTEKHIQIEQVIQDHDLMRQFCHRDTDRAHRQGERTVETEERCMRSTDTQVHVGPLGCEEEVRYNCENALNTFPLLTRARMVVRAVWVHNH